MPHQKMNDFGLALANEDWKSLDEKENPTEAVQEFEKTNEHLLNEYLPTKSIKTSSLDKP